MSTIIISSSGMFASVISTSSIDIFVLLLLRGATRIGGVASVWRIWFEADVLMVVEDASLGLGTLLFC
ncbi:hypothetical protein OE88DRAFT_1650845 [Heliocybe sulcata]|uniref:Uncharacterized protein n=1 Tax=Heliocybe sulcata TaxID=5364 RepID=A0A5C3NH29_9AGAM|nr:hypothetical protein OE88DRAFT_1650845 [Heliocybe sulcata]